MGIQYDNKTLEVTGICGIPEFYRNIEKLLPLYWPDWSGQFHISYPSALDSSDLTDEFITAYVVNRYPMKVDTSFGRSMTPMTKVPTQGIIQPKLQKEIKDHSKDDIIQLWTQCYDAIIRFDICAKTNLPAHVLAHKFEKFMRDTRHLHMRRGLKNLVFCSYTEDITPNLKFKETYRQVCFEFFVQYDDAWTVRVPRIKEIGLRASVNQDPYYSYDTSNLPLQDLPYDIAAKITNIEDSKQTPQN